MKESLQRTIAPTDTPGNTEVDEPEIEGGPFELRVHLRGMRPEDALEVLLPMECARLRIGELLDRVFPDDEAGRSNVEEMFDVRQNPDLPEIYDALLDAVYDWRTGRCVLKFSFEDSAEVKLSDATVKSLRTRPSAQGDRPGYPVLSLVLEQEYPSVDYIVEEGYWEDRGELIEWLQCSTLLYFLDKHEFGLPVTPATEIDRQLLAIAEGLLTKHIIALTDDTGCFAITDPGRSFIGNQIAETESYIDRYDIFKDVDYDEDSGSVEFGTGRGEDVRVQVFIAEGLDPIRVVFLLRLYDGTVDQFSSRWRQLIHEVGFYDEILQPVMDYHRVEEDLISWIIESGNAKMDEQEQQARENRSRQEILKRVRATESLSSDRKE